MGEELDSQRFQRHKARDVLAHVADQCPKDLFLAGEIGIERTERNARAIGYAADARLVVSLLAKFDLSGLQELVSGPPAAFGFRHSLWI